MYIYDVYDAEKRKVVKDKPNYTYNCSAVQLAYIIDTDVFAEEYGFDFPTIVTTTGTEIKHDDGVLTLDVYKRQNQNNYNQAMEYVNLTLERDTATKANNLLFLKFMIDCIGRDIETCLLYTSSCHHKATGNKKC